MFNIEDDGTALHGQPLECLDCQTVNEGLPRTGYHVAVHAFATATQLSVIRSISPSNTTARASMRKIDKLAKSYSRFFFLS